MTDILPTVAAERRRPAVGTAGGAAVMCVDHDGRLTVWSAAAERLYGYTGADVLGQSLLILDPLPGGPDPAPEVLRALRGDAVEPFESIRRRRDATVVPVEVTITPVVGDDGEVVAAALVHRDLSGGEAGAPVARAVDREVVDALPDAFVVLVPIEGSDGTVADLEVTDANAAALQDLGREVGDLTGLRLSELWPTSDGATLVEWCAEVLRMGAPQLRADEHGRHRGTGPGRHLILRAVPVSGAVVLTWDDATVAPETAAEAAEQARHFREIAEHSSDVVYEVGPDGRVRWISPSVSEVLGWSPDQVVGTPAASYIAPEDWQAVEDALGGDGAAVIHLDDVRFRTPDGSLRWMSGRLSPQTHDRADEDDGARGPVWTVALRDVDERVRNAAALADSEAQLHSLLESTDATLSRWSPDRRMTVSTRTIGRAEGADVSSLIGRTAEEMGYSESELGPWNQAFDEVLATAAPVDYEVRLDLPGGSVWWACELTPELDDAGQVTSVVSLLYDVTERGRAMAALAESEERFRQAMANTPVGMCIVAPDGRIEEVNSAMCTAFDRERSDLLTRTWQELTHPDDLEVDLGLVADVLAGRRDSYRLTKRYLRPDGSIVWGELAVSAVRDTDGAVRYFISQILDVTERVLSDQSLRASEALLRTVVESTDDAILRVGPHGTVDMVNHRVLDRSGTTSDDWIGRTLADVGDWFGPAAEHRAHVDEVLTTGVTSTYEFDIDIAGEHRWFHGVASPVEDGGAVHGAVVSIRDVTDKVRAEEELIHLATRDVLTGLANRSELLPEITRALGAGVRSGRYTAVLLMDLDRFKVVNDSLGHDVGDQVLDAAARRLEATVRDADLVVRTGGDEFVVVMRDIEDPSDVVRAAWRIVHAFRTPFTVTGADLYATASIGVSLASARTEPGDMVRESDTAMYVAKRAGGDRVAVFNEELRDAVTARLTIESDLRPALSREELAVWFQPEVDLRSGEIIAAEALLRWRHPDGEIWTADRFIEVAEESGLMVEIGAWVLVTACEAAAAWRQRHPDRPVVIRVNLSALQLVDDDLLDIVDDALARTGIPPGSLCVEITETALLRANQTMRDNFAGLHDRGIQIASDDFGTGYASLAYLHDYPIDVVKIDRSFIIDLTSDDSDARLVAGTIALAGHLDMSVTAEGVETPQQASLLRSLGCPSAQGYLFSPAIPGEDFERLLDHTFPTG